MRCPKAPFDHTAAQTEASRDGGTTHEKLEPGFWIVKYIYIYVYVYVYVYGEMGKSMIDTQSIPQPHHKDI